MKLVIQSKVQEPPHLIASKERRICPGTWSIKDLVDMIVATFPVAGRRGSVDSNCGGHRALCEKEERDEWLRGGRTASR